MIRVQTNFLNLNLINMTSASSDKLPRIIFGIAFLKPLLICSAMLLAAVLAIELKPTVKLAESLEKIDLETIIPRQFGEWRVDESIVPMLVSPDLQKGLMKVYNQTLSRTYINTSGERVMLSIAYGNNQSDDVELHLPEGCFGGQGFAVEAESKSILETAYGPLPIKTFHATKGLRHESVMYWIVVGDNVATTSFDMKKIKLRFMLKGIIPDGILIRISSINQASENGYKLQKEFTKAMLANVTSEQRGRLIGITK